MPFIFIYPEITSKSLMTLLKPMINLENKIRNLVASKWLILLDTQKKKQKRKIVNTIW